MEVWKDVKGYEGRYKVSNYGRVYSIPRKTYLGNSYRYDGGYIMKPRIDSVGYVTVCLSDGHGKRGPKKVHRLLAEAFIENTNNYPCINHKDENKTNNTLENLEWCTVAYNNNYGTHQQRSAKTRINHPKKSHRIMCVETGAIYPSTREASRQTGIDQSQIWHCLKEQWRRAKGTHWTYPKEGD